MVRPRPIAYFRLAQFIVAHQKTLFKKASSSKLSLAKVVANRTGLRRTARLEDVPYQRAMVRIGEHFLLIADVSRFYSSIYTHSIDWAISSKARAKRQLRARRRNPTVGTMVDQFVQACQSGQTRGIPIGPATSMLLAEILLGRVDARLCARGVSNGFRFADDYELIIGERSQAERALAILEDALSEFELELNPSKTKIVELPQEIDNPGIQELRSFRFRLHHYQAERSDLMHFFTRAFELHQRFPDTTILRYAVSRLSPTLTKPANVDLVQALILQAVAYEPGVWQIAIDQLLALRTTNPGRSKANIDQTIHSMIRKCAHMNHSSEIAWSVWAALVFEVRLSRAAVRAISRMVDDCCCLPLFHASQVGLTEIQPPQKLLKRWLSTDALRGPHWLLSYELAIKGWISLPKGDHISQDAAFDFFRRKNVQFYDLAELQRTRGQEDEEEAEEKGMIYGA
jgi:reverse transcriptase-like protein